MATGNASVEQATMSKRAIGEGILYRERMGGRNSGVSATSSTVERRAANRKALWRTQTPAKGDFEKTLKQGQEGEQFVRATAYPGSWIKPKHREKKGKGVSRLFPESSPGLHTRYVLYCTVPYCVVVRIFYVYIKTNCLIFCLQNEGIST